MEHWIQNGLSVPAEICTQFSQRLQRITLVTNATQQKKDKSDAFFKR